jgi:hypothetical protein
MSSDVPSPAGVPACRLARYPPSLFLEKLGPYEAAYKNIQGVLFFRRPLPFALLLLVVELLFLFAYAKGLGVLSVAALLLALYYAGRLLVGRFRADLIAVLFPPIDEGAPPVPNRIYPLPPFCQRLSHISSALADALERVHSANAAGSVASLGTTAAAFALLFLVFAATGTFWPAFVLVHAALLGPGAVMHPAVFPYAEPHILRLARAIRCPYCQAKPE